MMELADHADAVERYKLKDLKEEHSKITGFRRLMPFQQPMHALYIGIITLGISKANSIVTAIVMGSFMSIVSIPFESDLLSKLYPTAPGTGGAEILEWAITRYVFLLILAGFAFLILNFIGKRFFGMLSYNITYVIRKKLYTNILTKDIGYFDFPENSTPVLSSVM
jgi:hypothetical protein